MASSLLPLKEAERDLAAAFAAVLDDEQLAHDTELAQRVRELADRHGSEILTWVEEATGIRFQDPDVAFVAQTPREAVASGFAGCLARLQQDALGGTVSYEEVNFLADWARRFSERLVTYQPSPEIHAWRPESALRPHAVQLVASPELGEVLQQAPGDGRIPEELARLIANGLVRYQDARRYIDSAPTEHDLLAEARHYRSQDLMDFILERPYGTFVVGRAATIESDAIAIGKSRGRIAPQIGSSFRHSANNQRAIMAGIQEYAELRQMGSDADQAAAVLHVIAANPDRFRPLANRCPAECYQEAAAALATEQELRTVPQVRFHHVTAPNFDSPTDPRQSGTYLLSAATALHDATASYSGDPLVIGQATTSGRPCSLVVVYAGDRIATATAGDDTLEFGPDSEAAAFKLREQVLSSPGITVGGNGVLLGREASLNAAGELGLSSVAVVGGDTIGGREPQVLIAQTLQRDTPLTFAQVQLADTFGRYKFMHHRDPETLLPTNVEPLFTEIDRAVAHRKTFGSPQARIIYLHTPTAAGNTSHLIAAGLESLIRAEMGHLFALRAADDTWLGIVPGLSDTKTDQLLAKLHDRVARLGHRLYESTKLAEGDVTCAEAADAARTEVRAQLESELPKKVLGRKPSLPDGIPAGRHAEFDGRQERWLLRW